MQKLLLRVYNSRRLSLSLKIISHASVVISVLAYALLFALRFNEAVISAVKFICVSAVPFVIVSLVRSFINAPRPYELYEFYEKKPKDKAGRSFPSRHVFSAFMIAVLSVPVSLPLAVALLAVSLSLAASRVLLGIHFIRDVAAGGIIGTLSGVLGIIIMYTV